MNYFISRKKVGHDPYKNLKERLNEIQNITDDQIDYSDISQVDEEWFKNARLKMP